MPVSMPITSITTAIAAILLIALGMMVGAYRSKSHILLGTGNDDGLLRRVRAHGNFTEYVPIALILLGVAEMEGKSAPLLWTMAGLLIVGRLLHMVGILGAVIPARAVGMLMTMGAILLGAGLAVWS